MGAAMKRLCSICARGGSKGVPSKNVRMIAGKPLLAHSLYQARASGLFDALAVSSDADEILSIARSYGATCLVKRPAALASDTAAKLPAIRHCLEASRSTRMSKRVPNASSAASRQWRMAGSFAAVSLASAAGRLTRQVAP